MHNSFSLIFLAGGNGTRFGESLPKQYHLLNGKAVALHSLEKFITFPEIEEIVVVADPAYHHFFTHLSEKIHFALPGKRRQDSVKNGFLALKKNSTHILTHDSARPFVPTKGIKELLKRVNEASALSLANPLNFSVKKTDAAGVVLHAVPRDQLWEIQTPQLIERHILEKGLSYCDQEGLTATDDLYFAELLGKKALLIQGHPWNFKVTVADDLLLAERLVDEIQT